MKKVLFTIFAVATAMSMFAQEAAPEAAPEKESPWKFSGLVGLNASATGLWNWAAGGKNNVSGVAFGKCRLLYSEKSLSWETNLDLEYGLSWIDQKYDALQKSSDHLKFNTKFGWEFSKSWFLTASAAFETQMGYGLNYTGDAADDYLTSNILAPSYTDISVGIDWKPNDIFSIYLSPVSGRIATAYLSDKVNDKFSEMEGVDVRTKLQEANGTWHYDKTTNEKIYSNARAELGLNFKGSINYKYKDLTLTTALTLFTPYAWDKTKMYLYTVGEGSNVTEAEMDKLIKGGTSEEMFEYIGYRDNNRRFGNFDVDWTVGISYQFLKCLNVTLSTDLKYVNGLKIDKVITDANGVEFVESAERVQFQGVLGIGIGYSF